MSITDMVWSIPEFALNITRQLRSFLFQPFGDTNIPVWGVVVGGTALAGIIISIVKNILR